MKDIVILSLEELYKNEAFNKQTQKAIGDAEKGRNVKRYDSVEDLFEVMGYTQSASSFGFSAASKQRNLPILTGSILLILSRLRSANCDSFKIAQNQSLKWFEYNHIVCLKCFCRKNVADIL